MDKFTKPTVAEALLAALDRRRGSREKDHGAYDESRVEGFYLDCLADLGDKRIAAVLADRATKATTVARKRYATTAFDLGEPKPFLAGR